MSFWVEQSTGDSELPPPPLCSCKSGRQRMRALSLRKRGHGRRSSMVVSGVGEGRSLQPGCRPGRRGLAEADATVGRV